MITLSPLNQRRWQNFRNNRRAYWSLWIFAVLFALSLMAEAIANDRPVLVSYRGELFTPITTFYPETALGGDFRTEAAYSDPEVKCLILSGGLDSCFDDPDGLIDMIGAGQTPDGDFYKGWMIWPLIPYSFTTPVERPGAAPLPPNVLQTYTIDIGLGAFNPFYVWLAPKKRTWWKPARNRRYQA